MLKISVIVYDENGNRITALSKDPCHPQQLNSILSLCDAGYQMHISFKEVAAPTD